MTERGRELKNGQRRRGREKEREREREIIIVCGKGRE